MIKSDPKHSIIRRQIQSVEFGFYNDDDVRARSVCEVTSSVAIDLTLGTSLPNGLYDPRFGPFDTFDVTPCITCACRFLTCPGHAGHIELCVPVYHPLLFTRIMTLMRMKCLQCHKLRAPLRVLHILQTKMELLKQGRTLECVELDTLLARAIHQDRSSLVQQEEMDGEGTKTNAKSSKALSLDQAGRAVDKALRDIVAHHHNHDTTNTSTTTTWTSYERGIQRQLVQEVISTCKSTKQCSHCGAFSPKLRQDASNKIFQVPLSDTQQRYNVAQGIPAHFESAILKNNHRTMQESSGAGDNAGATNTTATTTTTTTSGYDSDESREIADELPDMDEDDDDDATLPTSNEAGASAKTTSTTTAKAKRKDKFMPVSEVKAQVQRTYAHHKALLQQVFGPSVYMFLQAIPVPPSRFRPPMKLGGMTVEHAQNFYLSNMIQLNERLRNHLAAQQQQEQHDKNREEERKAYQVWIELQTTVNCFMDSSKDPSNNSKNAPTGIRQILERKEGIFRKHMMGKRVDFACRSVISPDPYIGTNEIGIPLYFAKTLTYPTPVNDMNIAEMRLLVERGVDEYPGARFVEFPGGRRVDLSKMDRHKRQAVAARLLTHVKKTNVPAMVGRQLKNGDMMLVNRQPTLHKPGIMAHYVRVLHSPTQKTIRMHYTNCDTYNADFDGDEMNCHFPQNDLARAESEYICKTDLQYIVPTDGTPLRGLIQDHVDSGVKLTKRDTFLEKWQYQQLLFAGLASLPGLELIALDSDIEMMPPAILKPRELWTGKQVISTLLNHLRRGRNKDEPDLPGISTERKSKMPETAFGGHHEEHLVLIRDGELLRGVLDKASFGATQFSLVHGVYEAYGPSKAGLFLNALGRLFTAYLQYFAGHSCRMEDLILTDKAEKNRRKLVELAYKKGTWAAKAWADSDAGKISVDAVLNKENVTEALTVEETTAASDKIGELLSGSEGARNFASLDNYMMSQLNPLASEIIKACLPNGLAIPFPENTFSLMVTTGAKGSTVNQSQVSCCLGQQALEGRRVPRLSSGRTLPSFAPYDPNPRADGFVMDRFLTGIRPQEYYFHCMAGREGLVDTAVKTSRSGYLQRCLVKHLEELKVCYDFTVRNGEGCVVQFLYGEDGLDPTQCSYLDCSSKSLEFFARNHKSLKARNPVLPDSSIDIAAASASRSVAIKKTDSSALLSVGSFVLARKLRVGNKWVRGALCTGWFDAVITKKRDKEGTFDLKYLKDGCQAKKVPVEIDFGTCGGVNQPAASSICELIKSAVADPIVSTPNYGNDVYRLGSSGCCLSEKVAGTLSEAMHGEKSLRDAMKSADVSKKELGSLIAAKYSMALCAPGEAVGSIAAQSVGEPSTQMTLNTFHLAGAGANVTLGIPRLREIIMTASRAIKTPTMSIPLDSSVTEKQGVKLARFLTKLTLSELVASQGGIKVVETLMQGDAGNWQRAYIVTMKLHPAERIMEAFGLSLRDVATVVGKAFVPKLAYLMKQELRRSAVEGDVGAPSVDGADSSKFVQDVTDAGSSRRNDDDNNADELENTGNENDDDDEGAVGEEDGVMASRFGHKDEMDTYEDMDDEDRAATNQHLSEDEVSDGEEEAPSSIPADDEEQREKTSFKENQGVMISKANNTISLPPLRVDPSARPLLMVGLVERAAATTLVRSRNKIEQAFVNEEEGRGRCLQTAGVNFEEMWRLDRVDHNRLMSNDIWAVRCAYGVEAARGNIVEQIRAVFGAYGIEVDPHHLSLIADYMTFEGGYNPMNRIGMEGSSSPFLQMSFETTTHFLTQASLNSRTDDLASPSANLVVGRPIRHGTGTIELLAV